MVRTLIAQLCDDAYRLAKMQNWHIVGTPFVGYEFATIGEFHAARAALELMFAQDPAIPYKSARAANPDTFVFEFGNVKFLLACRQVIDHPDLGPMRATDPRIRVIRQPKLPPPWGEQ